MSTQWLQDGGGGGGGDGYDGESGGGGGEAGERTLGPARCPVSGA
jgi:hypothetical protein